jgi:hypothetical protein
MISYDLGTEMGGLEVSKVKELKHILGHQWGFPNLNMSKTDAGISQPWHCLAPMLSAKSQGSWNPWR